MSFPDEAAVEAFIDRYRRAVAELDAQTPPEAREEWQALITRMRAKWADWQGEDNLHEVAFGEPDE